MRIWERGNGETQACGSRRLRGGGSSGSQRSLQKKSGYHRAGARRRSHHPLYRSRGLFDRRCGKGLRRCDSDLRHGNLRRWKTLCYGSGGLERKRGRLTAVPFAKKTLTAAACSVIIRSAKISLWIFLALRYFSPHNYQTGSCVAFSSNLTFCRRKREADG